VSGSAGDAPLHDARLISRDEGRPLVPVALEVPAAVRSSHSMPGQYVLIEAGGESGYFVLASPVGAAAWRLLVKGGGSTADALLSEPIGATFPMTGALGAGFPMDEARGRPLVVAAAGTGIAAAPPIAARRIADGDAATTHVLLGLQNAAHLPCPEDVDAWRAAGMDVTLCVSREDGDGVRVVRGYVQDVARARLAQVRGRMIFAVGPSAMVDATRAIAAALGASEADVRTNY
jgi:sulfhydrogenase subunit gamma (sulfur reductase)